MEVTTSSTPKQQTTPSIHQSVFNINLARYESVSSEETEDRGGWVSYGVDNNYPQYLIDLFQNSPVHNAICVGTAEMIVGKGIKGDAKTQACIDKWKLNDSLPLTASDAKIQGGIYYEVILTRDLKNIAKVNHLPYENCRVSYNDETDEIDGVWYSRDWMDKRKARNKPVFIPLFKGIKAQEEGDENAVTRYVVYKFKQTVGSRYYPRPDYYGSLHYIELAEQIGVFHLNNIRNGFFPSIIAQFNNGQPDPEKAGEVVRDMERNLSGATNAGKMVVLFNDNPENAAKFDTFPLTDADKQYDLVQETAKEMVFVGHRVTSPLIFGIRDSSGLGNNANELTESLDVYMRKVITPYREMILDVIEELVKADTLSVPVIEWMDEQPEQATELKKKVELDNHTCCLSKDDKLTPEIEKYLIAKMKDVGEVVDTDEWELVDEQPAHDLSDTEIDSVKNWASQQLNLSLASFDNSDDRSPFGDSGLYKLRYAYSQNLSENSREFCREMVSLSKQGVVFRFEDIQAMSADGVNGQFAPQGASTYDIFEWKGGVYCHHFFKRQIYFRKREKGRFLPNDGLKNDKRVGNVPFVPQKGVEGIAPINTPTRGSLKNA